jgi:hypothetical protein
MRPSRLVLYSTLARTVHEGLAESQSSPNKVLPGWEFPVAAGVRRIFCSAKLHSFALAQLLSTRSRYLTNPCTPPALSRLALTLAQTLTSLRGRGRSALPTQCRGSTAPPLFTPVHVDSQRGSLRGAVTFLLNHLHLGLDNTDRT